MSETVALSRIYGELVNGIERVNGVYFNASERAQVVQLISDSFEQAVALYSQHCPVCDGTNFTIDCGDCKDEAVAAQSEFDANDTLAAEVEAELRKRGLMA